MKRVLIAAVLLAAPALHAQDPASTEADSAVRPAQTARTYPLSTVDVRPVPLDMEGFTRALHRLTFFPIAKDTLRQLMEDSPDCGKKWAT